MARGWESKAVEAQQQAASENTNNGHHHMTAEQAEINRQRQALVLNRNRVLQQLQQSTNPRYTEMLESALADLDAKLARLP